MNQGWSCPGCGKCYSPTTPQCFTCGQPVRTSDNTGGYNGTGTLSPKWPNKSKVTLGRDIGFGCHYPMSCERKDGYCAKCHSEYY
jgi:hypothetical protein